MPGACHVTDQYSNKRVESDHARLKARLRPMRGLKQSRSAFIVAAGHALVQNVRGGHHDLAAERITDTASRTRSRNSWSPSDRAAFLSTRAG